MCAVCPPGGAILGSKVREGHPSTAPSTGDCRRHVYVGARSSGHFVIQRGRKGPFCDSAMLYGSLWARAEWQRRKWKRG